MIANLILVARSFNAGNPSWRVPFLTTKVSLRKSRTYCGLDDKDAEAKLLASSKFRIEQTDYDGWDGGTDIYTSYLEIPTAAYSEVRSDIENIQKGILEKARFVLRTFSGQAIGAVLIDPEIPYDPDWRRKIRAKSLEDLVPEIEKHRNLMIAVATGGPSIRSVNDEYVKRQAIIGKSLAEHGIADPNPYADLWKWYGKWSSGDLPTYQSRREYISDLYAPLIDRLEKGSIRGTEIFKGPTGWAKVDRGIGEIRKQLEQSSTEEQFQAVGLLCRETLISLAQTVYDSEKHPTADGISPSQTDAKRMLEAYINKELAGSTNEASRRHAKASLELANDLQHKKNGDVSSGRTMC